MIVRPVTVDDIPEILDMLRYFREESPEYNYTEDDASFVGPNLEKLITSGIMFGVIDNDNKGVMLGALSQTWYSRQIDASEQVLFVYPPYRGGFTAIRLVHKFEERATALGATVLGVGVSSGVHEEQTARMYEKLGFIPKGVSLMKRLK